MNIVYDVQTAPIGIFDSGVGGLSVYLHLQKLLPNERFIYYADTQNVPYGEKSSAEIARLSILAVQSLVERGAKLVVVACNSASAHALSVVRASFALPIVGLVPAIKPACGITQSKKIAVLATRATLDGALFAQVVQEYAVPAGVAVFGHFEPKLVPWVESGMPINHAAAQLLIEQMYRWIQQGVDTLVLGCTHYPFFRDFLQTEINKQQLPMTLIDSGLAVAERTRFLLQKHNIDHTGVYKSPKPLQFFASKSPAQTAAIARSLIGQPVVLMA